MYTHTHTNTQGFPKYQKNPVSKPNGGKSRKYHNFNKVAPDVIYMEG